MSLPKVTAAWVSSWRERTLIKLKIYSTRRGRKVPKLGKACLLTHLLAKQDSAMGAYQFKYLSDCSNYLSMFTCGADFSW